MLESTPTNQESHMQRHGNEQFNDTISWFDRHTQFEFQYSAASKPNVEHQHIANVK